MSFSLGKTLSIGAISSTVLFTLGILSAIISRYHKPIVHTLLCLYLIFHITASIVHTTMLFISYEDYQLLNENRKQCGLDEKLEDYLGPWNAFFSLYSLILASIQAVFNLFVFVGFPLIKKCEDSEVDWFLFLFFYFCFFVFLSFFYLFFTFKNIEIHIYTSQMWWLCF